MNSNSMSDAYKAARRALLWIINNIRLMKHQKKRSKNALMVAPESYAVVEWDEQRDPLLWVSISCTSGGR
jgi:hypothetical protein